MASIRVSFFVVVMAAWAGLGSAASAASTAVAPATRCTPVTASAIDAPRDDTFVAPPPRCSAPEEPRPLRPAEVQAYDGPGPSGASPRAHRGGVDLVGSIGAFSHFFGAFDAAAAHHLLPRFVRRHRVAAPEASIPSF